MEPVDTYQATKDVIMFIIRRAAQSPPKINKLNGHTVLFHGSPLYLLGLAGILFAVGIFLISLASPPWKEIDQTISFIALVVFFSITGICCLLEAFKAKVLITDENILAKAPWPGYPRVIQWEEVTNITYSNGFCSLVIAGINGTKIRISPYTYGIKYLVDYIEQRFDSRMYEGAKPIFDLIKTCTNDTYITKYQHKTVITHKCKTSIEFAPGIKLHSDDHKTAAYPTNAPEFYNDRGIDCGRNNLYTMAITNFSKAIELDSEFASAYFNRAQAYEQRGYLQESISDYKVFISLSDDIKLVNEAKDSIARLSTQ
ncbi:MAG: tetratricopeptide repeat protein [Dehalococcoidia bacterium]